MRSNLGTWLAFVVCGVMLVAGCGKTASTPPADTAGTSTPAADGAEEVDEVTAAINELPEAERTVALAQKYCPVAAMSEPPMDNLLGGMGKPFKVTLEGKDVFLCCEHCKELAEKDPAATLAKVEELKTRAAGEK
jgi:hypothetical protein